jgi:rhodanese-related sulfurtransferase
MLNQFNNIFLFYIGILLIYLRRRPHFFFREPHEFEFARIESSVLIPLNRIPQRLGELNPQQEIVVICHHGMRSQQACLYLVNSGFEHVANLTGGIDAWSCDCDSSVLRY